MSRRLAVVVFDLAGTTVNDRGRDGLPIMVSSMLQAFKSRGIEGITQDDIHEVRGREKRDAIRILLSKQPAHCTRPAGLIEETFQSFCEVLRDRTQKEKFCEIPGTSACLEYLKCRGVSVYVGSGFPSEVVEAIVEQMGWKRRGLVKGVFSSQVLGHSRPHPAMIHAALSRAGVIDPLQCIKVGDTAVDVQEGRNAGVHTVAVLTGTQGRDRLEQAGPDAILPSIAAFPEWIIRNPKFELPRSAKLRLPGARWFKTSAGSLVRLEALFLDCDGCIFNSNDLKTRAYRETLLALGVSDKAHLERFIATHLSDVSVSRYVKFQRFFEEHAPQLEEDFVKHALEEYGEQCLHLYDALTPEPGALDFVAKVGASRTYVCSGGAETELNHVFKKKSIRGNFAEVLGSPSTKIEHLERLTDQIFGAKMISHSCLFIGDGWTDLKTAEAFNIPFLYLSGMSDWRDSREKIEAARRRGADVTICETWSDVSARLVGSQP